MAETPENYWPPELPDPDDSAPVALLKQQAELLADRTNGEIEGLVRLYIEDDTAYHTLFVRPVIMEGVLYKLLSISYPIPKRATGDYPINAECSDERATISDDEGFRSWLRSQLNSDYVRSTLGFLKKYIRELRSIRAAH